MSVNSSSSPHDDLPQSSFSNFSQFEPSCLESLYISFCFTSIVLLLPLSVFILYLGFKRWTQRRSSAAVMSHCDFLTYNMAVTELIGVFGNTISICAIFAGLVDLKQVGINIETYLWSARMLFPILSCVERYMAVVQPITYLRLRRGGGVHIRNISSAYIWLQGFAGHGFILLMRKHREYMLIPAVCEMLIFLISMLFCSLSVLYVLIRPRPGEVGGNRLKIHRSKQRALHTILMIMGVLFLRFAGGLVCSVLLYTQMGTSTLACLITAANAWLSLPGSLLLLLLFLHRAGKLPGWRQGSQSA